MSAASVGKYWRNRPAGSGGGLPLYVLELNEIERDWRHLKQHCLANQSFRDWPIDVINRSRSANL